MSIGFSRIFVSFLSVVMLLYLVGVHKKFVGDMFEYRPVCFQKEIICEELRKRTGSVSDESSDDTSFVRRANRSHVRNMSNTTVLQEYSRILAAEEREAEALEEIRKELLNIR